MHSCAQSCMRKRMHGHARVSAYQHTVHMSACMCMCTAAHMSTHMSAYVRVCPHVCTYVCTHVCIHTCIHARAHTCAHVETHAHAHACAHVHTRVYDYARYGRQMRLGMHRYMHMHQCIHSLLICEHTRLQTYGHRAWTCTQVLALRTSNCIEALFSKIMIQPRTKVQGKDKG